MKLIPYYLQEKYNIDLMELIVEDYLFNNKKDQIDIFLKLHSSLKINIKTRTWLNYICSKICIKYDLQELDFNYNELCKYIRSYY